MMQGAIIRGLILALCIAAIVHLRESNGILHGTVLAYFQSMKAVHITTKPFGVEKSAQTGHR